MQKFLSLFLLLTSIHFLTAQVSDKYTILTRADCTGPNGPYTTEIHSGPNGYLYFKQIREGDQIPFVAVVFDNQSAFSLKEVYSFDETLSLPVITMLRGHDFQRMARSPETFFGPLNYEGKTKVKDKKVKKYTGKDLLGEPVNLYFNNDNDLLKVDFTNSLDTTETIEILFRTFQNTSEGRIVSKVEIIQAGKDIFTFDFTEVIFNCPFFEMINPESIKMGREVLKKSIAYHDPEDNWPHLQLHLEIQEPRTGNPTRYSEVTLNNDGNSFHLKRLRSGRICDYIIDERGHLSTLLDGNKKFTFEESEKFRLDPSKIGNYRDFYSMMYGLPMVFKDQNNGKIISMNEGRFKDTDIFVVNYQLDKPIIGPIWKLLISKSNYELLGIRIIDPFQPERAEEILFQGTSPVGGIKIPQTRHWIDLNTGEYGGSDIILKATRKSVFKSDYMALLKSNEIQRIAHLTNNANLLVGEIADTMISVQNGKVIYQTNEEVRNRFENYFKSVRYEKWDDLEPPLISISDDGSLATVVLQKETVGSDLDQNNLWSTPSRTVFAWTSVYRKIKGKWKIVSNTSTRIK